VNGIISSTALWFASRATGIVALVLLTVVMVLGIAVNRHGRLPGLPRFAVTSLHRAVSLLAVAFLAVHIGTAIADPFVSIGIVASVIPFVSHYQPFWLGIGAVSVDLMLALTVTSLLRGRIGRRTWRVVHWLAYASWPVAFAHSIGSGPDLWRGGLLDLTIGCVVAIVAAIAWRVIGTRREVPLAQRAAHVLDEHSFDTQSLDGQGLNRQSLNGQAPASQSRRAQVRHDDFRPKAGAR
jgi:methionine sulfoxide reductase heme-binding subunit